MKAIKPKGKSEYMIGLLKSEIGALCRASVAMAVHAVHDGQRANNKLLRTALIEGELISRPVLEIFLSNYIAVMGEPVKVEHRHVGKESEPKELKLDFTLVDCGPTRGRRPAAENGNMWEEPFPKEEAPKGRRESAGEKEARQQRNQAAANAETSDQRKARKKRLQEKRRQEACGIFNAVVDDLDQGQRDVYEFEMGLRNRATTLELKSFASRQEAALKSAIENCTKVEREKFASAIREDFNRDVKPAIAELKSLRAEVRAVNKNNANYAELVTENDARLTLTADHVYSEVEKIRDEVVRLEETIAALTARLDEATPQPFITHKVRPTGWIEYSTGGSRKASLH